MTATAGVVSVGLIDQQSHHVYVPKINTVNVELDQAWQVVFDGRTYSPLVAATAIDGAGNAIPALGTVADGLYCISVTPTQRVGTDVYDVRVIWRNDIVTSHATITFDSQKYIEGVYYDNQNKPVVNSANDFYNPPAKKDFYLPKMIINYELTTTPAISTITGAVGSVNSDSVSLTVAGMSQTFPVRTLKLETAPVTLGFSANSPVWKITYNFLYQPNTFDLKLLDEGYSQLNPTSGLPNIPILDGAHHPVTHPVPLNGSGAPMASGGTVSYNTFQVESQTAMSPLIAMIP